LKTITIGLSKFRATCLKLMDEVKAKRFIVVITKRGKPIAKMIPVDTANDFSLAELVDNITPDNVHPETDFGSIPMKSKRRVARARRWKQS
jgi:prevent-host-death family protein